MISVGRSTLAPESPVATRSTLLFQKVLWFRKVLECPIISDVVARVEAL